MTAPTTEPARGREPRRTADEVLTMGRMGIDIYPLQIGTSLRHVESFGKFLGGSPANVAVAAARLGRRSAIITHTGADPFGDFLHDALQGFGVDDRFVTPVADLPTPVTFCEIFPPDDFPLYFYRRPSAPDMQITADELDLDAIRDAEVFWVTVTGLSEEPSREATLAALRARAGHGYTVLDLDYRPMFWSSREEARKWIQEALPFVDVAVGNLDECESAVGEREPHAAARALHDRGVPLAIVKQGPKGVLASEDLSKPLGRASTQSGSRRTLSDGRTQVEVPPVPVDVVNGLGAGDAFGGALCHSLLAGWELERSMRFCNAAGAIVAGRLACADAMPTPAEVEAKLVEAGNAAAARG
ncbi:MAG: 5-dehydro-2-deoxygluconokinase [Pseudonocardia sp.]|nr:5-dehydro-2-deoxygluconokinase [Pseudonocardia sp.]